MVWWGYAEREESSLFSGSSWSRPADPDAHVGYARSHTRRNRPSWNIRPNAAILFVLDTLPHLLSHGKPPLLNKKLFVIRASRTFSVVSVRELQHERPPQMCVTLGDVRSPLHTESKPTSPLGAGGLGHFRFQPPSSPSGRGLPLPPPPPLDLDGGGGATRWSVQDGPTRLQERLRESKMTSKTTQDSPRCINMPPRMLQYAPRPPQDASKKPNSSPRAPPRNKKSFKNLRETNDVCLLTYSLPMAIRGFEMAPRGPRRAPKRAQEGPKTAPRAPQEGSRRRF